MSPTEVMLLAVHRAPVVRLADVCEQYLNNEYPWAQRKAALNALPFPAFKLGPSKKAPWMVRLSDLAEYLDRTGAEAQRSWKTSQV